MLNYEILKHPLNWLIVPLMLTIAAIGGHLLLTHFGAEPASGGGAAAGDSGTPPGDVTRKEFAASVLGEQ